VRNERAMNRFEKLFGNDSPASVTPFRPRIGEQQMEPIDGLRRKKMANGVGAFDAQDARITQLALRDLAASAADTSEQTFRAEKIFMPILLCERREKRPIPTAKIHFERRYASEQVNEIERRKIILGNKLDGRGRGRKFAALAHLNVKIARGRANNGNKFEEALSKPA
jgi:hypothetical protein